MHAFDLEGHPKAARAYAGSSPIDGSERRRLYAVLHVGAIRLALDAVRAAFGRSGGTSMDSGWAALLGSVVGGVGTFGATWLNAYLNRKRPDLGREAAKALLRKMLEAERFRWRYLGTLANVVGLSPGETRMLLLEIGARGSERNSEVWGLLSRNPFDGSDPEVSF